jgi:hypothetical protein
MSKQQLRNAEAPLPATQVVNPDGLIKDVQYGAGINGGIVEFVPGRGPRISQEARERGWLLLSEMYKEEGRDAEHNEYLRFRELASKGQVNPESFPETALPKEVLERRARAAKKPAELPTFELKTPAPPEKSAKGK